MTNNIYISAITGLVVTLDIYNGSTLIHSNIPTTEIGTTGEYFSQMPNTPFGRYLIIAKVAPTIKIASQEVHWGGNEEIDIENVQLLGLNPNAPSTTNIITKKWTAGDIEVDMTGDLQDITTMTRNL